MIAPELLLGTRIQETLSAAGHEVTLSPSVSEAPLDAAELLIADVEREKPEAVVGLGIPVLGFYPHTDAELRQAAEAAGVTWWFRARGSLARCRSWSNPCWRRTSRARTKPSWGRTSRARTSPGPHSASSGVSRGLPRLLNDHPHLIEL